MMLVALGLVLATEAAPLEREVRFSGRDGFELVGTLASPPKAVRSPAVLLLPGSGPTDRNGNQPPLLVTDLLKSIATDLANHGVASLRFDKRAAHGYATKWPRDAKAMPRFFDWDAFVQDAEAAFAFLKTCKEVDGGRLGLLGHSEGGSLVLAMVERAKVGPVKAIALLSTPGRPISEVLHSQIARSVAKLPGDQGKPYLEELDRLTAAIGRTGEVPAEVSPGLRPLFPAYIGPYFKGWLNLRPIDACRRFDGAALVLNGEKDIQISATLDAPPLAKALKSRAKGATVSVIVTGASHNLKPVANESEPGFAGPPAPRALAAVRSFFVERL